MQFFCLLQSFVRRRFERRWFREKGRTCRKRVGGRVGEKCVTHSYFLRPPVHKIIIMIIIIIIFIN